MSSKSRRILVAKLVHDLKLDCLPLQPSDSVSLFDGSSTLHTLRKNKLKGINLCCMSLYTKALKLNSLPHGVRTMSSIWLLGILKKSSFSGLVKKNVKYKFQQVLSVCQETDCGAGLVRYYWATHRLLPETMRTKWSNSASSMSVTCRTVCVGHFTQTKEPAKPSSAVTWVSGTGWSACPL